METIHANGMTIDHGLRGGRTIVSERNGRTIVNTGALGGYLQRPYLTRNDTTYYLRTYVVGGHSYARVYRGWDYRGVRYYAYVPAYSYDPRFYVWAANPWLTPVYYSPAAWGWVGTPWFGFYADFFTPYPAYASASQWLADYLLAANLQAAYQTQAEANAAAAQAPPNSSGGAHSAPAADTQTALSPEVKQAIVDEVRRQLAARQAAAGKPLAAPSGAEVPAALNPAERVFVVSRHLDVTVPSTGQECSLTSGDVMMRLSDTPDANQNVTASIQSSKKSDCAVGQTVAIGVQDLQEMHNQFLEQLDDGLKKLIDKGGRGGLPKPPGSAPAGGEVPTPPPDPMAAKQLIAQQQQADQTEQQVAQAQQ